MTHVYKQEPPPSANLAISVPGQLTTDPSYADYGADVDG